MGPTTIAMLGGLLGQGIDSFRQDLQHERTKELMGLQNKYQVEQFGREIIYNDPSNAVARWRKAGINPRAIYGKGSNGAGIAGGLSPAPNASAHNPLSGNYYGGLASTALEEQSLSIQKTKVQADKLKAEAEALKANQEAKRVWLENKREEFMQNNGDLFRELNQRGWEADVKQVEAYKASVDKAWYRFEKQQAFDINQAELDNLGKSLEKYNAEIEKLKDDKKISEQQYENLKEENKIIQERYNTQVEITNTQKELTKEVASRKSLNDQKVQNLITEAYQGWVKIGVEGAKALIQIVDVVGALLPGKSKAKLTQQVEEIVKKNSKGKVVSTVTKTKDILAD